MNLPRRSLVLLAVLALSGCGSHQITAPDVPAPAARSHANEGFLGSGNNTAPVPAPDPVDPLIAAGVTRQPPGTAPVR
ncbi:MAG TPA: hypothetical protein VFH27_02185 [Longimicrobiaceae bacterium]|nr:hypothetical protein [Longimicrobiaceae bacterium]